MVGWSALIIINHRNDCRFIGNDSNIKLVCFDAIIGVLYIHSFKRWIKEEIVFKIVLFIGIFLIAKIRLFL